MGRVGWIGAARVLALVWGLGGAGQAQALPLLRLYLAGDVDRLGNGGGDLFRDLEAESLRLERPAALARQRRPHLELAIANEQTFSIRSGEWNGTRGYDRHFELTFIAPLLELGAIPVTGFASVRHHSGLLLIQNREHGPLIDSVEAEDRVVLGLATALPFGVSLGASVDESGTDWLLEALFQPNERITSWVRRRSASHDYRVVVPEGIATNLASPELLGTFDNRQPQTEVGASLGGRDFAWLRGGWEVEGGRDHWVEAGARALPQATLQVGLDRETHRLHDKLQADGTGTIASMALGAEQQRAFGGLDWELTERDRLVGRYVHSRLQGGSHATEVGSGATRAFLQVDYPMGLLLQGGYSLRGDQIALGWTRHGAGGIDFSVGAQYLRVGIDGSDLHIDSRALGRRLASERAAPAGLELVGLTGAIHLPMGPFRLSAAFGQLVPLAIDQADDGGPPSPPPPPRPKKEPAGPYDWLTGSVGKALRALDDYGGGNRLLLRLSTDF